VRSAAVAVGIGGEADRDVGGDAVDEPTGAGVGEVELSVPAGVRVMTRPLLAVVVVSGGRSGMASVASMLVTMYLPWWVVRLIQSAPGPPGRSVAIRAAAASVSQGRARR